MLTVGKVGPGNAGYYQSAVVAGWRTTTRVTAMRRVVWVGRADLVGAVAGSLATAVDSKLLLEAKCAPDGTQARQDDGDGAVGDGVRSDVLGAEVGERALRPRRPSVWSAAVEAAHTAAVEQAIASLSPRIAYTRTGHAGAAVVDAEGVFGDRLSASHQPGAGSAAARSRADLERGAHGVGW